MKRSIVLLAAALIGTTAMADGNSQTAKAKVSAFIAPPIKIKKLRDLWFGELIMNHGLYGNTAGSLTITQFADVSGGTRTPDEPGFITVVKKYEPWHNAEFEVTGWADAAFAMTLSSPRISLTNQDGATTSIDLVKFNRYHDEALDQNGKASVWVGGKLTMNGTLTPGMYSGNFEVHVNYN